jgi:hypothetical protein
MVIISRVNRIKAIKENAEKEPLTHTERSQVINKYKTI